MQTFEEWLTSLPPDSPLRAFIPDALRVAYEAGQNSRKEGKTDDQQGR